MRRATLRDVARRAGTSVAAVSAVVNPASPSTIRVGEATRDRILDAVQQLDYSPNLIARSLITRKTHVLGLVFPYATAFTERTPFFTELMSGVFEEAIKQKLDVMLHTAISENGESALPDLRADGLILVLPAPGSSVVERCVQMGVPVVTVVSEPMPEGVCTINADEFEGGKLATQHLIDLGHRRIAHFMGHRDVATTLPRLEGYRAAIAAAGIDREYVFEAGFTQQSGLDAMRRVLLVPEQDRPTAAFAANDHCAGGAISVLRERGFAIPEDFSIVGYDDTWYATLTDPPLTSVRMPIYEMGAAAVSALTRLSSGSEAGMKLLTLPVSLTVRQSSASPSNGRRA